MVDRLFRFETGKLYVARVVLKGLQRLASPERVASEATQKLGMQVTARKVSPGEFVLSGIWRGASRQVELPSMVVGVTESG